MNKKDEKIVIGHKNPDTDTVVSAYLWSSVLRKKGEKSRPAIAGKINKETKLVFKKAKVDLPKEIDLAGKNIFLVDHNEEKQRAKGVERVVGIIDHHKLSITTEGPIFFRNEPLGSTASIIKKIIDEQGIELEKEEKLLLLSAIISDTLKFNSPTTTETDKNYAKEIAAEIEVDIDKLAEEMFAAKSDLSDLSLKEIIEADYKDFEMGESKVGVGVAEVAAVHFFKGKTDSIIEKMKEIKMENDLDYLFFGVVDILNKETHLYLIADEEEMKLAKKAFNIEGNKNPEVLRGVASRKKQIVPPLSKVLKK
jgi:manganese-dependent inorganic pyrophosphatase